MKNLMLLLVLILPVMSMAEEPVALDRCQTSNYVSPHVATLMCNNGHCTTQIQWPSLSANGKCDSGKQFNAYGNVMSSFVQGQCNNGFIQLNIPSQSVQFNGTCTDGRLSVNSSYTQSQFVSASCSISGVSTVFLPSSYLRFDGYCN